VDATPYNNNKTSTAHVYVLGNLSPEVQHQK